MRYLVVAGLLILAAPRAAAAISVEELHAQLGKREFAALDAALSALRAGYRPEPAVELGLWNAFNAFALPAARTEDVDAWLQSSPASYDARLAAAMHYESLGWRARGTAYAYKTTPTRFAEAHQHYTRSMQLARESLALAAETALSHALIIDVARHDVAGEEHDVLYAHALQAAPRSFLVRLNRMSVLQPKWGGSYAVMDELIEAAANAGLPPDTVSRLRARKLAYLANDARERDDLREALARAQDSLALHESAYAHNIRGRALRKQGDEDAAREAFRRAAQLDPYGPAAHGHLASGHWSAGEIEPALDAYRRAAHAGSPWAAYHLGLVLLSGERGVRRDAREAAAWIAIAAHLGDARAMHGFGECYYQGDCPGVGVDRAQAMHWFRKSHLYGSGHGTTALAALYWDGVGTPRDAGTAMQLWREARRSEHAEVRSVAARNLLHALRDPQASVALARASGYPAVAAAMLLALILIPLAAVALALRDGVMTLTRRKPSDEAPRTLSPGKGCWLFAWLVPVVAGIAAWAGFALGMIPDIRLAAAAFVLLCAPSLVVLFEIGIGDWRARVDAQGLTYLSAGTEYRVRWDEIVRAARRRYLIRLETASRRVHAIAAGPASAALWREIEAHVPPRVLQ